MKWAIIALLLIVSCNYQETENFNSTETSDFKELTGLDTPWAIDFLPDGTMIFTERKATISLYDGSVRKVIANIEVNERAESGLMGIAIDPEFDKFPFVYVYYNSDNGNRISRFSFNGTLYNEKILLDGIPAALFHDGGRLKFGPDGKLYATTGDATLPSSAQNLSSLAGKILRMNKDGTIPDNPFGTYVYSYGHRNPQGLAWADGQLYASEHGPSRMDEINLIEKGENYGWPKDCSENGNFVNPVVCYTDFTLAPAGMDYHEGAFYVAGLRGGQLRKIVLGNGNGEAIISDSGRIRDVVYHKGYLYIATSNRDGRGIPKGNDDKIFRIKP